jgi:hypothetical protein
MEKGLKERERKGARGRKGYGGRKGGRWRRGWKKERRRGRGVEKEKGEERLEMEKEVLGFFYYSFPSCWDRTYLEVFCIWPVINQGRARFCSF